MLSFRDAPVRLRVPATSANLGPGFDCAGLSLALYDEIELSVVRHGVAVQITGEGAQSLPHGERHLIVKAARAAFTRLGGQPPGLRISCLNRIPHSRGLGSSSAVLSAGVFGARALVEDGRERMSDDAALALATELEGHPDNVAACLRGGATFAWGDPVRVLRVEPHADLRPVAFVPPFRSSTKATRGLLPATVPFADAAANAGRAALLVHALTLEPALLLDATRDWLHQGYRAPAMPETARLVDALRADAIAATVSGAGPTVLALVTTADVERAASACPAGWTVHRLEVDLGGVTVV